MKKMLQFFLENFERWSLVVSAILSFTIVLSLIIGYKRNESTIESIQKPSQPTYNIENLNGDIINANEVLKSDQKVINKMDTSSNKKKQKNDINAPNALIATQGQTGGTNTVNINAKEKVPVFKFEYYEKNVLNNGLYQTDIFLNISNPEIIASFSIFLKGKTIQKFDLSPLNGGMYSTLGSHISETYAFNKISPATFTPYDIQVFTKEKEDLDVSYSYELRE